MTTPTDMEPRPESDPAGSSLESSVLASLPFPVLVEGPDGIEWSNPPARALLERALGAPSPTCRVSDLLHQTSAALWTSLREVVLDTGTSAMEELMLGRDTPSRWQARVTRLDGPRPRRLVLTLEPSATALLPEEAILESGCILWDAILEREHGTLRWARRLINPEAAQLVLPLDQDGARDWMDLFLESQDPTDALACAEAFEQALIEESTTLVREFRCRDRHGDTHWISETLRLRRTSPTTWRLTGVGIDITPRKQSEDEIRHALGAARSASLAKSEFLANMSHEIRTPMNAVLGMTELLLQTPLSEDQRDLVSTAHRSGRALLAILNDILDLSKIEADRVELHQEPFDLRDLCEEVAALFAEPSQERGVEILTRYRPEVPARWTGDPGRIRQILSNLVGNAVKFTERGCIVLEVRGWVSKPDNRGKLAITVRDSGVGIPSEKISNLFQPFVQADMSTTRRYGGTGLGLAISRRLAKRMQGDITVSSRAGEGAVFRLSLTLDNPVAEPQPAPSDRRVVVLTQVEELGRSLVDACMSLGIDSLVRPGVEEAVQTCRQDQSVRWILADLPEDAFSVLQRSIASARSDVRVVRLVPLHQSTHLQSSPLAPHLTKPVRLQSLARQLGRADNAPIALSLQGGRMVLPDAPTLPSALRILVAEDNQVNQKVILRQLDRLGIQADLAEDGEAALRALEEGDYHLAFLDVQMPRMEGPEVARRWREKEAEGHLQRTPLVALTASALIEERDRCLESGMDVFLSKPVSQAELAQTMAQWARVTP